ncbi:hypothetical protein C8F01DRAFT_1171178, partial [Mycena amicta]
MHHDVPAVVLFAAKELALVPCLAQTAPVQGSRIHWYDLSTTRSRSHRSSIIKKKAQCSTDMPGIKLRPSLSSWTQSPFLLY